MTEKIEFGKVEYSRYKRSHGDKLILENGNFMIERKIVIKGWDSEMRTWNVIGTEKKLLPLSEHNPKLSKVVETLIILQRTATDYATLKTLKAYFTQKLKISVKDAESNLYLSMVDNKVFMNALLGVPSTVVMPMSRIPKALKIERLGEPLRITDLEASKLLKEKYPLYEEFENGEIRLLI